MKISDKIGDFLEEVKNKYESLPESQKQVAQYITKDLSSVATHSALQIAQQAGVSDATVIRFAISLGFSGYSDMQNYIRNLYMSDRSLRKFQNSVANSEQDNLFTKVKEEHKNLIEWTYDNIDDDTFDEAISLILNARNIYTLGLRTMYGPSYYLGSLLNIFLGNAKVLSLGSGCYYEDLVNLSEEDLIIAMCFTRYTKLTYEVIEFSKEQGVKIISISDSILSPTSKFADIQLAVPTDSSTPYDSIMGLMSLIEAMIASISIKSSERVESNLDKFEKLIANKVFIK